MGRPGDGRERTNRGLGNGPSSFPRGRLPPPPAPGTAPSQTVNPLVAEQPRGNRCGYARYDVADHGLPSDGMRVDGQLVRQIKTCLRSWGRRRSAARTGPPLPPVGRVNACGAALWPCRLADRDAATSVQRGTSLSLARPVPPSIRPLAVRYAVDHGGTWGFRA